MYGRRVRVSARGTLEYNFCVREIGMYAYAKCTYCAGAAGAASVLEFAQSCTLDFCDSLAALA